MTYNLFNFRCDGGIFIKKKFILREIKIKKLFKNFFFFFSHKKLNFVFRSISKILINLGYS
jgi:hypothetical protein